MSGVVTGISKIFTSVAGKLSTSLGSAVTGVGGAVATVGAAVMPYNANAARPRLHAIKRSFMISAYSLRRADNQPILSPLVPAQAARNRLRGSGIGRRCTQKNADRTKESPAPRLRLQTSQGPHLLSNKTAKSACAACVNLRSLHLLERLRLLFHILCAG